MIWLVVLCVGGLIALLDSLVGGIHLGPVSTIFAGGAALVWNLAYFAIAWATAGRTFGQRLMQLRVVDQRGRNPRLGRAFLRAALMGLCVAFAFLGFLPVLFDPRRRGVHDILTRTTVRYDTGADAAVSLVAADGSQDAWQGRHIRQIANPRVGHRFLE